MDRINERIVKISGSANVPNQFELGDKVSIWTRGEVVKIEHIDNQDGTKNVRFVVKAAAMEAKKE